MTDQSQTRPLTTREQIISAIRDNVGKANMLAMDGDDWVDVLADAVVKIIDKAVADLDYLAELVSKPATNRDMMRSFRSQIISVAASEAFEHLASPKPAPDALGYATRLLTTFVSEHFPPNPDWKPLPDLIGVLTQIDNAITIARDYKACLTKPVCDALREALVEYSRDLRRNSSGGDDYPWEIMTGIADNLDILIQRFAAPVPPTENPVPDSFRVIEKSTGEDVTDWDIIGQLTAQKIADQAYLLDRRSSYEVRDGNGVVVYNIPEADRTPSID